MGLHPLGATDASTLGRQTRRGRFTHTLVGQFLQEIVNAETTGVAGGASGGENVIGTCALISERDRGLGPKKERSIVAEVVVPCLLYTSPSPRDKRQSRMPSSA